MAEFARWKVMLDAACPELSPKFPSFGGLGRRRRRISRLLAELSVSSLRARLDWRKFRG
jgi:hypothetical protein